MFTFLVDFEINKYQIDTKLRDLKKLEGKRQVPKFQQLILNWTEAHHMSKKTSQALSKLWKTTVFHIFLTPGQQESEVIYENLQIIMNAYTSFEKTLICSLNQLRTAKLNIPALAHIRSEITKSKHRVQKFVRQQSQIMTSILSSLSQFRFLLQKSELAATREYTEMIGSFLEFKDDKINTRKLERIHEEFMSLNYKEKTKIRDNYQSTNLEKWLADFYVRSQDFFLKAYSQQWQQKLQEVGPFVRIKPEQSLSHFCFRPNKEKIVSGIRIMQSNQVALARSNLLQKSIAVGQMEDEQNDIVSQIFKEIEKDPSQMLIKPGQP